ncbi:MAG: TonB-dependent receptor, partial [Candidatus Latescibacteria bacterium]|nr:TonB-dependent receptor [Candidatus Latescibacterota bacterium]NIO78035.1 TonB-dependent receptor [Candidatus Latescibacterota bacterium]
GEVEAIVSGTQDVTAFFAEALIPITERLQTQIALRYEDYGAVGGTTTDPKVSMKFDVTDSFSVRGSWGTSFQA